MNAKHLRAADLEVGHLIGMDNHIYRVVEARGAYKGPYVGNTLLTLADITNSKKKYVFEPGRMFPVFEGGE